MNKEDLNSGFLKMSNANLPKFFSPNMEIECRLENWNREGPFFRKGAKKFFISRGQAYFRVTNLLIRFVITYFIVY